MRCALGFLPSFDDIVDDFLVVLANLGLPRTLHQPIDLLVPLPMVLVFVVLIKIWILLFHLEIPRREEHGQFLGIVDKHARCFNI